MVIALYVYDLILIWVLFQNAKDWLTSTRVGKALEAVCPWQVRVQARARSADALDLGEKARENRKVPTEKGARVDIFGKKLACTCGYHQQAVSVVT